MIRKQGFTIVELLIVIVVIAILAAITIVAFNGIQQRARDSERKSELVSIQKALEMYYTDNGGYPGCNGVMYIAGGTRTACSVSNANIVNALSPKYIATLPRDPVNVGANSYYYATGHQKTGPSSYNPNDTTNYILGAKLESTSAASYSGWTYSDMNYITGSSN